MCSCIVNNLESSGCARARARSRLARLWKYLRAFFWRTTFSWCRCRRRRRRWLIFFAFRPPSMCAAQFLLLFVFVVFLVFQNFVAFSSRLNFISFDVFRAKVVIRFCIQFSTVQKQCQNVLRSLCCSLTVCNYTSVNYWPLIDRSIDRSTAVDHIHQFPPVYSLRVFRYLKLDSLHRLLARTCVTDDKH